MYRIKKAAAAIYGWDWPLLTFIYPGFDCGSHSVYTLVFCPELFTMAIERQRLLRLGTTQAMLLLYPSKTYNEQGLIDSGDWGCTPILSTGPSAQSLFLFLVCMWAEGCVRRKTIEQGNRTQHRPRTQDEEMDRNLCSVIPFFSR